MAGNEQDRMEQYSKSNAVKQLEQEQPDRDRSASESLQKTDTVKKKLRMVLRSQKEVEEWDEEKGDWVSDLEQKENVDAVINEQGLDDLWTIAEPVISETAAGSNLSEKDVAMEGFQAMKKIVGAIMVKHDEYDIPDEEAADLIVAAFDSAIKNNLKKAEGGRLLDHHEESRSVKEFISENRGGDEGSSWNPFS